MDNSPKLKTYLLCIRVQGHLPKFLAYLIINFCEFDEQFKYGAELVKNKHSRAFIFEKACEVDNIHLVRKYFVYANVTNGFKSACMRNNLKTINFLNEYITGYDFIKVSINAGYFKTAWMLSKKLTVFRPRLFYRALSSLFSHSFSLSFSRSEKEGDEKKINRIKIESGYIINLCLKKKISFDYALSKAIRKDNKNLVEKIVELGAPCDAGLKLAFMMRNFSLIGLLSKKIVNKVALLKKLIRYSVPFEFWNLQEVELKFLADYGMVQAAKYGNEKAYKHFILLGGAAFNEALAKACKYEKPIFFEKNSYCSNCLNKNH